VRQTKGGEASKGLLEVAVPRLQGILYVCRGKTGVPRKRKKYM
jgi:hypothetical protein